MDPTLKYKADQ